MTLDNLVRFSDDLSAHGGLKNTLRRMGDQVVLKIGGREFFFHRDGRYLGIGETHHAEIADLVESIDIAAKTGEFDALGSADDAESSA